MGWPVQTFLFQNLQNSSTHSVCSRNGASHDWTTCSSSSYTSVKSSYALHSSIAKPIPAVLAWRNDPSTETAIQHASGLDYGGHGFLLNWFLKTNLLFSFLKISCILVPVWALPAEVPTNYLHRPVGLSLAAIIVNRAIARMVSKVMIHALPTRSWVQVLAPAPSTYTSKTIYWFALRAV